MLESATEGVIEPVRQSGDAGSRRDSLIEHRDQRVVVLAVDAWRVVGVVRHVAAPAGLDQHAVGHGGRPGERPGVPGGIEIQPLRFRRPRRRSAPGPVARAVLL